MKLRWFELKVFAGPGLYQNQTLYQALLYDCTGQVKGLWDDWMRCERYATSLQKAVDKATDTWVVWGVQDLAVRSRLFEETR